jgi:tetratricopeptide (TPR) repeat protein
VERKQFEEALRWSEQALKIYPENITNRITLGYVWFESKEFAKARECISLLLRKEGLDDGVRFYLMNNIACADFLLLEKEAAAGRSPGSGGESSDGGETPELADLLREADQFSHDAFTNVPWVPQYKGTRGCVLIELGRLEEGICLVREVLLETDLRPQDYAFCAGYLALAKGRQGQWEECWQLLESARQYDPTCVALEGIDAALAREKAKEEPRDLG